MKIIGNKITQEKDEFGVIVNVNHPTEDFPDNSVRIVYDGVLNQWQVCENDQDVSKIMVDYPVIKEVVDLQKEVKSDPVDDGGVVTP